MMNQNKKARPSAAQDTIMVVFILLFVKLAGFIKQAVIAASFGTGIQMDAYLLVSDFIGEIGIVMFTSLSVAFLNYYIRFSRERSKEEKDGFVLEALRAFIPISFLIILMIAIFAKPVSFLLAPGFSGSDRAYVERYLLLLSIAILNSCCGNIFTAVLEAEKDFGPGKLSGLFQSICMISGCLLFSGSLGVDSLIYSYLLYCVIQNVFLFIKTLKYVDYKKVKHSYNSEIKEILHQSVPLFVSNAVIQVNAVIDKAIASGLGSGSISALSYGYFIFSSVHSILIGGSASVVFSHFSTYAAEKSNGKLEQLYKDSICLISMILLPIILFLCLNSRLVVQFFYGRGAFDNHSVYLTAGTVAAYSAGLFFLGIKDITIRLHYAFQNTKSPMKNSVISVFINILFSLLFAEKWGCFGIALASSMANGVGMALLLGDLKNYITNFRRLFEKKFWQALGIAGIVSVVATVGLQRLTIEKTVIAQLSINGLGVFCVYFGALLLLQCKYMLLILNKLRRKQ